MVVMHKMMRSCLLFQLVCVDTVCCMCMRSCFLLHVGMCLYRVMHVMMQFFCWYVC